MRGFFVALVFPFSETQSIHSEIQKTPVSTMAWVAGPAANQSNFKNPDY
jgi:hypothetical protein